MEKEIIALMTLNNKQPCKLRELLHHFQSPSLVLDHFPELKGSFDWEKEWEEVEKKNISLIPYTDPCYPKNLLQLSDFPILLYVQGELKPEDHPAIAIVGTRACSLYGRESAERFAENIASHGTTVISGLARGIDTAAHRGALKSGRTLAVIGSGLSNLYPKENKLLAEAISKNGAIISEYPMKTPPFKSHFPKRNRIVSGLSQAIVLIESPMEGGGMLTMELGARQCKALYVLPGRIDMPSFEGNHAWIKSGKAQLIDRPEDLHSLLKSKPSFHQKKRSIPLSEEEKKFLSLLPSEEKSIDELVLLTQFPVMKLNVLLTSLVLKKAMKEFPGKIYKKVFNID